MGCDQFVDRLFLVILVRMILRVLFMNFPRMSWLFMIVVTRNWLLLFMLEILVLVSWMGDQNNSFVFVGLLNVWLIMILICIERKHGFSWTVNINETFARSPFGMCVSQFLLDFFRLDLFIHIMMLWFVHWWLSLYF